jgi:hypothetical protein
MSQDCKPSTRKLLELIGWRDKRPNPSLGGETYLVHEVTVEIGNRMYRELGRERYKDGNWPVAPSLVAAAQAALPENSGTYAAESLAYLLVRSGACESDVLMHLHPWDSVIFRWRNEGLTAQGIATILRDAGLNERITTQDLASIDGWIAEPVSALDDEVEILYALFGEPRIILMPVRDMGFEPDHHQLFEKLLTRAAPPVPVENVSQVWASRGLTDVTDTTVLTVSAGPGEKPFRVEEEPQLSREGVRIFEHRARGIVRFTYERRQYQFQFSTNGTLMDVPAVLNAADRFLAGLNRPERVFEFRIPRGGTGDWSMFITAPEARFKDVAERLGVPLTELS